MEMSLEKSRIKDTKSHSRIKIFNENNIYRVTKNIRVNQSNPTIKGV